MGGLPKGHSLPRCYDVAKFSSDLIQNSSFAEFAASYKSDWPGQIDKRIVLAVALPTSRAPQYVEAVLDTASAWCILDPEMAEMCGDQIDYNYTMPVGPRSIRDRGRGDHKRITGLGIRDRVHQGRFGRVAITLQSEANESYQVDTTVFVPELSVEKWTYPTLFLGLQTFLNVLRWAVDPEEEVFYFGPLGGNCY